MSAVGHVHRLRVYYEDTDAAGVVYYANYLKFAERARTELLRAAGIEQRRLDAATGVGFRVQTCDAEFRRPAFLDDEIEVRSRLTALVGARLEAAQDVVRGDDVLARLRLRLACVGAAGRPTRLPADLRRALAPFCQTDTRD